MELFLNTIKMAKRINDSLFNQSSNERNYYISYQTKNGNYRKQNRYNVKPFTSKNYSLEVTQGPFLVKDVFFNQKEIDTLLSRPALLLLANKNDDDTGGDEDNNNNNSGFLFSNDLVIRSGITGNLSSNPITFSYWFETLKGERYKIFHPNFFSIPLPDFGYSVNFRFRGYSIIPTYVWAMLGNPSSNWFITVLDSLKIRSLFDDINISSEDWMMNPDCVSRILGDEQRKSFLKYLFTNFLNKTTNSGFVLIRPTSIFAIREEKKNKKKNNNNNSKKINETSTTTTTTTNHHHTRLYLTTFEGLSEESVIFSKLLRMDS